MHRLTLWLLLLALPLGYAEAGRGGIRLHEEYDPRYVEMRIIVMPAKMPRNARGIEPKSVSALLATELLRFYEVIDLERLDQYLTDRMLTLEDALAAKGMIVIRDSVKVDAVASIDIFQWSEGTPGLPLTAKSGRIGALVRLSDPFTGKIYWSINRVDKVKPGMAFLVRTTSLFTEMIDDLEEHFDNLAESLNEQEAKALLDSIEAATAELEPEAGETVEKEKPSLEARKYTKDVALKEAPSKVPVEPGVMTPSEAVRLSAIPKPSELKSTPPISEPRVRETPARGEQPPPPGPIRRGEPRQEIPMVSPEKTEIEAEVESTEEEQSVFLLGEEPESELPPMPVTTAIEEKKPKSMIALPPLIDGRKADAVEEQPVEEEPPVEGEQPKKPDEASEITLESPPAGETVDMSGVEAPQPELERESTPSAEVTETEKEEVSVKDKETKKPSRVEKPVSLLHLPELKRTNRKRVGAVPRRQGTKDSESPRSKASDHVSLKSSQPQSQQVNQAQTEEQPVVKRSASPPPVPDQFKKPDSQSPSPNPSNPLPPLQSPARVSMIQAPAEEPPIEMIADIPAKDINPPVLPELKSDITYSYSIGEEVY